MIEQYIDTIVLVGKLFAQKDPQGLMTPGTTSNKYLEVAIDVSGFIMDNEDIEILNLANVVQRAFYRTYRTFLPIPYSVELSEELVKVLY